MININQLGLFGSDDMNNHKQKCLRLSHQLGVKYSKMGILEDGMMKDATLSLVKNKPCEEVLHASIIVVQALLKLYQKNIHVQGALEQILKKERIYGNTVSAKDAIESLVEFHSAIFNFYTPGWIEMHRLESNPEMFTDKDLDYIREIFLYDIPLGDSFFED